MKDNRQIEVLKKIWTQIPRSESAPVILTQDEVVRKFLSLFHPGEFFYCFFDTRTGLMQYVSPEISDVLGFKPDQLTLSRFMDILHPDDLQSYIHQEQSAIEFFSRLPPEKLTKYKFSRDLRLRHKDQQYRRILLQTTPLYYFPEGGAYTLCVFTDITFLNIHGQSQLSFIGLDGEPSFYNVTPHKEIKLLNHPFSKRELEIIKCLVEGYSSLEIATSLSIAKHTVNTHRRNILSKSKCNTTAELIATSIREGWL